MRTLALALALLVSGCCGGKASEAAPANSGAGPESKAAPTPAAASDLSDVDLKPLPLSVRVPKGGMGAMDMSLGDHKAVTVDLGDGVSLNVQPMTEKDMAALKKTYRDDKILFPFKKFVREDAASFVVEFVGEGKTGYIGVSVKDIGGKKYVCKTTGLEGEKSADAADQHLKVCDRLKAK